MITLRAVTHPTGLSANKEGWDSDSSLGFDFDFSEDSDRDTPQPGPPITPRDILVLNSNSNNNNSSSSSSKGTDQSLPSSERSTTSSNENVVDTKEESGSLTSSGRSLDESAESVQHGFEPTQYNILFIGNPGTGKSSLLNTLGGKFAAGHSADGGLTTSLSTQSVTIGNDDVVLTDIPGINNVKFQDRNIEMLYKAFSNLRKLKIVFFIQLMNGQLSREDLVLVDLVIGEARGIFKIGIIINKCSKQDVENRAKLEETCRQHFRKHCKRTGLSVDYIFIENCVNPISGHGMPPPNTGDLLLELLEGVAPQKVSLHVTFYARMKTYFKRMNDGRRLMKRMLARNHSLY